MPFHQKDSVGQRLLGNKQLRRVSVKVTKSNAMFFGLAVMKSDRWHNTTMVKMFYYWINSVYQRDYNIITFNIVGFRRQD